jgi:hypothetical protein
MSKYVVTHRCLHSSMLIKLFYTAPKNQKKRKNYNVFFTSKLKIFIIFKKVLKRWKAI